MKKTKDGHPLFVFWDRECLNDGQNWEMGFIRGLKQSQVIILLLSNTVCYLYICLFIIISISIIFILNYYIFIYLFVF